MAAVANRAHAMRTAGTFGITGRDPEIDPRSVQRSRAERHRRYGAELLGRAFHRPRRAGDPRRRRGSSTRRRSSPASTASRRAASSSPRGPTPSVPPIPGLDSVPYFTNETIFDNQERLHSLIIIGGGPERAGARAGAQPARLARHGAGARQGAGRRGSRACPCGARAARGGRHRASTRDARSRASRAVSAVCASTSASAARSTSSRAAICCSHRGASRRCSDLGLEAAGIRHDERGIKVTAVSRPRTAACSPSATWPAARPMRRWPTTTPASSSAGRCSTLRRALTRA